MVFEASPRKCWWLVFTLSASVIISWSAASISVKIVLFNAPNCHWQFSDIVKIAVKTKVACFMFAGTNSLCLMNCTSWLPEEQFGLVFIICYFA